METCKNQFLALWSPFLVLLVANLVSAEISLTDGTPCSIVGGNLIFYDAGDAGCRSVSSTVRESASLSRSRHRKMAGD